MSFGYIVTLALGVLVIPLLLHRLAPEQFAKEAKKRTQFKDGNKGGPGRGKTVNPNSGSPKRDVEKMHANSTAGKIAPDAMAHFRGLLYNQSKKDQGKRGTEKMDQSEPSSTAETIAKDTGVSSATIKRDGKFAEAVETLGIEKEDCFTISRRRIKEGITGINILWQRAIVAPCQTQPRR